LDNHLTCYSVEDGHPDTTYANVDMDYCDDFNTYELTWWPSKCEWKMNGKTTKLVTSREHIPKKDMYWRLHSRSEHVSDMSKDAKFTA